jgi:hypothetical protein
VLILMLERGRDARSFLRPAAVATSLGAAFLCVELALIQRFTLAAGGTLYAVSFVLFSLLAWSAAGVLIVGSRWRRLRRGVSWASLVAGLAVASTALLAHDLEWLNSVSSDAGRLLLITAILAPVGLAIGCRFGALDPPRRAGESHRQLVGSMEPRRSPAESWRCSRCGRRLDHASLPRCRVVPGRGGDRAAPLAGHRPDPDADPPTDRSTSRAARMQELTWMLRGIGRL